MTATWISGKESGRVHFYFGVIKSVDICWLSSYKVPLHSLKVSQSLVC